MKMSKNNLARSVDKIVCRLVNNKQDLQKAQAPINKLGNDEYFRALEGHKSLRQPTEDFLPAEIIYMIDKEIRMKFRKERIQSGSSKLSKHNKQSQNLPSDHTVSCSQIETLKKEPNPDKTPFEQWMRKKEFENKVKQSLMMRALKSKYENDLLEEQDREEKNSENAKKIKEWETQKIYEYNKKLLDEKTWKIEKEHMEQLKRKEAEEHYREWLKNNMIKLKQEKKVNKLKKLKDLEEKKKKEEQEAILKKKTEENFRKWIASKKKKNNVQASHPHNFVKVKKPVMLAYSPNRKYPKEKSYQVDSISLNDTPQSSVSERKYLRQVSSKPNLHQNYDSSSIKIGNKKEIVENSSNENYDPDYEEESQQEESQEESGEENQEESGEENQEENEEVNEESSEVYESSYNQQGGNLSF
jgi:hypothetical protein